MRINAALTIAILCVISSTNPASAQIGLADPKRGQELSARLCSACHIVSPGSTSTANIDVPTFAAIAGRPDTTAERLAGSIIVPHQPMPNTQLTVAEMRDIIAYILKPMIRTSVAPDMSVGDEILSRLSDLDADLLVMGAYGHSRMRELVFGGATRHIARHMTVPTLLSH